MESEMRAKYRGKPLAKPAIGSQGLAEIKKTPGQASF
jgi:hypothetical protein